MRRVVPFYALFFLSTVPAPPIPAQVKKVHPTVYASEEGPLRSYLPFARTGTVPFQRTVHWLQVHDKLFQRTRRILALAFRREGTLTRDIYPSFTVTLELALSTARTSALHLADAFQANHGKDIRTVIPKTRIVFPATFPGSDLPEPGFPYVLSFSSRPFTLAAGRSLCWEVKVFDNNLRSAPWDPAIYFDAAGARPEAQTRTFGKGSFAPGGTMPMESEFSVSWSYPPASVWTFEGRLKNGPPGGYGFLLFASRAAFQGIPLPGGEGLLYVDPLRLLAFLGPWKLGPFGTLYVSRISSPALPALPAYPNLYGTRIYGQFICVPKAYPVLLGSSARVVQLPRKWLNPPVPPVGYCYYLDLTSPRTPWVWPGRGLIVRFLAL